MLLLLAPSSGGPPRRAEPAVLTGMDGGHRRDTPVKAAGPRVPVSAVNPKNLLMGVAGGRGDRVGAA